MLSLEKVLVPYKGRTLDRKRRVEVYRNLQRRDGTWYSVRQHGKVIGHAKEIWLDNVYFVVQQAGRRRALRKKQRNVHAWVLGMPSSDARPPINMGDPFMTTYNPWRDESFVSLGSTGKFEPITCAMKAKVGNQGVLAWMKRA
jgi:hypothetical protein